MREKFGRNHSAVEAFLTEVAASSRSAWAGLIAADTTVQERPAARKATVGTLSAAVRGAVDKAARDAIATVGLTNDDLPRRPRTNARDYVVLAAIALAMGDELEPEHREVLLRPFVAAGFHSVGG